MTMADSLKTFENYTEYLNYIQTTRNYPNVAYIKDSNEVKMNPKEEAGQRTVVDLDTLFTSTTDFYLGDLATRIIVPPAYSAVGQYACYNCRRLTDLVLPKSVKTVGTSAFYNCQSLVALECTGLETIGANAFSNCFSIQVINLPAVKTIRSSAFGFCRNLQRVTLGINTKTIEIYAFYNAGGQAQLTNMTITCKATTPPTLSSGGFPPPQYITAIRVPANSVEAYKTATNWAQYADKIIAIPE